MRRLRTHHRVYVGLIPTGYLNLEVIARTIKEGMLYCGVHRSIAEIERLNPKTRFQTLLRPDLSQVNAVSSKNGYTHPEITRATIDEFLKLSKDTLKHATSQILVSDFGGAENRLQMANGSSETYRQSGYYTFEKMFPSEVQVLPFEETTQSRYLLSKGDLQGFDHVKKGINFFSPEIQTSRAFADSDFTIYCPKLKTNLITDGLLASIAMGSIYPNPRQYLSTHVVDMLEICNPGLIISDGIVAGVGSQYFGFQGHELGVMLISNNTVAHDYIASMIFGLDPAKIDHLKLAAIRGWGPGSLSEIEVGGAGIDTVKLLTKKTDFWDFHRNNFQSFSEMGLPFEILADMSTKKSISQLYFSDWLQETYRRLPNPENMKSWPKISVVIGRHTTLATLPYPSQKTVLLFGSDAINAFEPLISKYRSPLGIRFRGFGVEFCWVQLKNAKKHFLVKVKGRPPLENLLFRALVIVDLATGRFFSNPHSMIKDIFKKEFFIKNLKKKFSDTWKKIPFLNTERNLSSSAETVLTYKLLQNRWWAGSMLTHVETSIENDSKREYSQRHEI